MKSVGCVVLKCNIKCETVTQKTNRFSDVFLVLAIQLTPAVTLYDPPDLTYPQGEFTSLILFPK